LAHEAEAERRASHRDEAWRLARAGAAALKARRPAEAVADLDRALDEARAGEMPPAGRADLEYARGHALLDLGRTADAVAAFRSALAASPHDAEYHYMLGFALYQSHADRDAAPEFAAALAEGLTGADAERARTYLDAMVRATRPPARLSLDAQLSAGYDSNYLASREVFQNGTNCAGQPSSGPISPGAPELGFDLEPHLRLAGHPANGLFLGVRANGLLYASRDADCFSLMEGDLYLEGALSPRRWLTLTATLEGYFQTSGVVTFAPYQTGGLAELRALFLEGDRFATRLRYTATYMHALQGIYSYMTGFRHEASLSELLYAGSWRVALGYRLAIDDVGSQQNVPSTDVLSGVFTKSGFDAETSLENVTNCKPPTPQNPSAPGCTINYFIPYSYVGNDLGLEGDGELGRGFHLGAAFHWEHRNYTGRVAIDPDPITGYHHVRIDDRFASDLWLRRVVVWGIQAQVSLYLLVSRSSIDNTRPTSPYDFDNKNYLRFVGTFDVMRAF
jgi:hypothetical protein